MNKSGIVLLVYAYALLQQSDAIGVKLYNLCNKAHTGLYLEATFKSLCQYNIRQSITAQNKLLVSADVMVARSAAETIPSPSLCVTAALKTRIALLMGAIQAAGSSTEVAATTQR
eukprot:12303-Heterococcus_DN1.PRE.2